MAGLNIYVHCTEVGRIRPAIAPIPARMSYLQHMTTIEPGFLGFLLPILWAFMVALAAAVLASLVVLIIAAIRALNAYSHDQRLRTAMLLADFEDN